VPTGPLKKGGAIACPIFYLNYNPSPFDNPWRDTIGYALKAYRSAVRYDIAMPRDFASAMNDILSRIGKQTTGETSTGLF
jgi:hypothetical protein